MSDLISREEAKKFLYERLDRLNDDELYDIFSRIIDDMYNELSSVEPERKKGKWICECDAEGEGDNLYRCEKCSVRVSGRPYDIPNYCPNCGADMRGKDNNVSTTDGEPIGIDKAVEHYERTLETLKDIDLEVEE